MTDDQAAVSMSYICSLARPRAELTMLTGSGADETTSDYGFRGRRFYSHSQFGGFWPDDNGLQDLFPWHSFYNGTQRMYLAKEEYVTGSWGIEG